jgi:Regulator of chromosome condensation (RCC1) repeat
MRKTVRVLIAFFLLSFSTVGPGASTVSAQTVAAPMVDVNWLASCVLGVDATLKCFGLNSDAMFGTGVTTDSSVPVAALGATNVKSISMGQYNVCVIRATGVLSCAGIGLWGVLANGGASSRILVDVPGLTDMVSVAVGDRNACGVRSNGAVTCWGDLSLGTRPPAAVLGLSDSKTVAGYARNFCVLRNSGRVFCWGPNAYGSNGNGTTGASSTTALEVSGLTDATAVTVGNDHACAIRANKSVVCWGRNSIGELGDGTATDQKIPANVVGLTNVTAIDAGYRSTCAVTDLGAVQCWGFNGSGQLGNRSTTDTIVPVSVSGMSDAVSVSTGEYHTCIQRRSGRVACFGRGDYGQLGYGATSSSNAPVSVLDTNLLGNPIQYEPVTPSRFLDTRTGSRTIDGKFQGTGEVSAGSTVTLAVAGRADVEANASTVVVNVTVTGAKGNGYITVWPCGAKPNASSLNFTTGETIANLVLAKASAAGNICLSPTSAATQIIVDMNGYFPASAKIQSVTPTRMLDTRIGGQTFDNQFVATGPVRAGGVVQLQLAGRASIPADVAGVALNVTAVSPASSGYITVWPCDATQPNASNLNFARGQTIPNMVVSKLSNTGKICLSPSETSSEILVDFTGYFPAGSTLKSVVPARILDTRSGGQTVDAQQVATGIVNAGAILELKVTGRAGVAANATTAVLNVTVDGPTANGYLTVWPCDAAQPNASNINFVRGQTIPNLVVSRISANGTVCIAPVESSAQIIADLNAWI